MATIREALKLFEGSEHIIADAPEYFDVEIKSARWMASCGDGGLRYRCGGGDEIVGFIPKSNTRRALVLIREDNAGEAWDRELAARVENGAAQIITPRPVPVLRLVQTA